MPLADEVDVEDLLVGYLVVVVRREVDAVYYAAAKGGGLVVREDFEGQDYGHG